MGKRLGFQGLLLAALMACDGSGSDGSNPNDEGAQDDEDQQGDEDAQSDPSLAHLSADYVRYLRGLCAKLAECGGAETGETEAECVAVFGSLVCTPEYATVVLPQVDACLGALTCETLAGDRLYSSDAPAACVATQDDLLEAVGIRIASQGQGCGLLTVCTSDTYCDAEPLACGTCRSRLAGAEACDDDRQCQSGRCHQGGCAARLPTGASCGRAEDCESDECSRDGVCKTRTELLGTACSDASECGSAQRCHEGKCAEQLAVGDACTSDDDCDFACAGGVCALLAQCGQGEVGEPCATEDHCAAELHCDYRERRCAKTVPDGEPCDAALTCGRDSYCTKPAGSDELGKCSAKKAAGAPCATASECMSLFCSREGRCADALGCQ